MIKPTLRLYYSALITVNFVHSVNNFVNMVYTLWRGSPIKQRSSKRKRLIFLGFFESYPFGRNWHAYCKPIATEKQNQRNMKGLVEADRAFNEIKAMYKLVQKKLGIRQSKLRSKTFEKIGDHKYSPRYIVRCLKEKYPNGKAYFYFNNKNDHLTLSSNGQLNVRGGKEDMFKPWGSSEFSKLKPQTVFKELEEELIKIHIITSTGKETYSFDSYGQFIDWLPS